MNSETKLEQEKEFTRNIRKHQGILLKICYMYARNQMEKEDLYQEMTLQLWKSFSNFKGKSRFSTWMYRVALNTAITLSKKRHKEDLLLVEHTELITDSYENSQTKDNSEDIKILRDSISRLNQLEKAIILLWLEEKKYEEIAEIVGISQKNVSVKLVRIKKKLAKIIKKMK